ncbi:hypothetical protein [Sphingomonas elodea]|uniref:hypothetical protein n=1 Tax=Sphingomonas elodea TaxID=179878 RepID=UPI0002631A50|nr:hypothetical protein [Sphingomonas elodea]
MKLPLVPLAAVCLGGIFACSAAAAPASLLHSLSTDGWIPSQLALGGRPLIALATGAVGGGAGAFAAMLMLARREAMPIPHPAGEDARLPMIRRANALPDARSQPPLGVAFDVDAPPATAPASEVTERALPVDLDQPLAAFDPQAIPSVPLPPPVPRRERAGSARDTAERLVRPETDATVHALLERLERGVVRRNQAVQARTRTRPDRGLDDALATLRNLVRQA